MISKANTHNNGAKLADYMANAKDGERAEVWQLRGFEADNIKDAFRDVEIMAVATRCKQPLLHVQVRNRNGELLTRQQWEYAADRIERMLGLTGQPRAIAFHTYEDTGYEHMHVAWSRIDEDKMKAIPLPFFKLRLKKLSRELEAHFEFKAVSNFRNDPIKFAPKKAEEEQARRLGLDIHAIRNTIRTSYDRSDSGRSFQAALQHEGLVLARGDRRDFLVVDHEGGIHALGKRILDVSAAKIRSKLSDIDRRDLPEIQEIRSYLDHLQIERPGNKKIPWQERRNDRDTVRDQIDWEDRLARAALQREDKEQKFAEPSPSRTNAKSGDRKERVWPIKPPQSEHKSPRVFDEAADELLRDTRPEKLKGKAAEAWQAWTNVVPLEHVREFRDLREKQKPFSVAPDPKAFATELDKKGVVFAVASKTEAEQSQRKSAFARAIGNASTGLTEGEIVIVSEPPLEYRRDGAIQVRERVHKLDQSVAEKFVAALGGMEKLKTVEATLKQSDERYRQRKAEWEAIRLDNATKSPGKRTRPLAPGENRAERVAEDAKRATGRVARKAVRGVSNGVDTTRKPLNTSARVIGSAASGVGKALDVIGDLVESIAAPKLTPEQVKDAEKARATRKAEADQEIEFSRYNAAKAEQVRVQQEEAAREREREAGGRER